MTKNYLVVERSGKSVENIVIRRNNDNSVMFEDLMNTSYNEMKSYRDLGTFVECVMDATNEFLQEGDEQTLITLIGSDDVFIWGILVAPGDTEGSLKYALIDWGKDGKKYRYKKDEKISKNLLTNQKI